jgi:predicted  nucleic acid-binding Zn-ribbon protein
MSVLNERNSQLEEELAKVKGEAKTLYVGYEKTKARLKETKEIYSNVGKEVGEMEEGEDDMPELEWHIDTEYDSMPELEDEVEEFEELQFVLE